MSIRRLIREAIRYRLVPLAAHVRNDTYIDLFDDAQIMVYIEANKHP